MTNLEFSICEAENNGEIDLDTRDTMLGLISEATKYKEMQDKIKNDIEKIKNEKDSKINKFISIINTTESDSVRQKAYDKIKNIEKEFDKKIDEKKKLFKKLTGYNDEFNFDCSSKKYGEIARKQNAKGFDNSYTIDSGVRQRENDTKYGVQSKEKTSKLEKRPTGLFAKESTDEYSLLKEMIYESELNGDITIEERVLLLERLEEKYE